MFKKLNPFVLLAILAVLLIAVVLILRMDARKQQGSFLRELINADKSKVTSIIIIPKGMVEEAITLERQDDRWMAGSQGKTYQANREQIERIFETLSPLAPEQLVSRTQESWAEYEINDVSGTRVKVYENKKLTGDFTFGKLSFQQQMIQGQQRPKISTYVRLSGQDDVYSVDGFLGSAFPSILKQYRDQAVLNVNDADIEKILVKGGGNYNYEIKREVAQWLVNGQIADSAAMAYYLTALAWTSSDRFVEELAEGQLTIPSHQMTIERVNFQPVEIRAYPADTAHLYFITSSQNPGAVFSGSQNDLFESIFHPQHFFVGNQSGDESY